MAAIRCAQLGLNTACVDKWKNARGKTVYGGTCLNVGCIPSKALLESSYNYERIGHFAEHGVIAGDVKIDLGTMQKRKQKVVDALTTGIGGLFKKNKVTALAGTARILGCGDSCQISVTDDSGKSSEYGAKSLIIATGSVPREIPVAKFDHELIIDNEGALAFDKVPKRLGVVGSGVIGLELGSVWKRLGSEVRILEALPEFLPTLDRDMADEAFRIFTKEQKLDILLSAKVESAKAKGGKVQLTYSDKEGKSHEEIFDRLVVAVGRAPYTNGLGLGEVGIEVDEQGFIKTDGHCRTSVANVYAIGDVIHGPMLAHKAEEEGVFVAECLAGQKPEVNYDAIPWVIYTHPEIAWVGETEMTLDSKGIKYKKGVFPFIANGRARGIGDTKGMVKLLAHAETDRLLGAQILGGNASDMIAELVMAIEFMASAEDIARTVHAHPTLSEVVKEAALATDGRAIHI